MGGVRYKPVQSGEWVKPVMRGYRMKCCDCGLVHEMQFKAIEVKRHNANGTYQYVELARSKYRVTFRLRRANGHTKKMRAKE